MIQYLKIPLLFCTFFAMATAGSMAQNNLPADEHSFVYLSEQFGSPGKQFGSAPLWVWNTDVNRKIIDTMLLQFKENNFGGVFIHPGLITEYLSDEWFNLVSHTLKKGKELGLQVWIYDENS